MQPYIETNMEDYDEPVSVTSSDRPVLLTIYSESANTVDTGQSSSDSSSITQDSEFQEAVVEHQMTLLGSESDADDDRSKSEHAPIIAGCALDVVVNQDGEETVSDGIPQLGLLAGSMHKLSLIKKGEAFSKETDPRLFFNVSHPSSVFICGSQGSGKSHTLSCLLENCLIQSKAGKLPNPLTGLVFHYDTFFSDVTGSPCEAAFLSSHPDVKVRVLCSPTNIWSITVSILLRFFMAWPYQTTKNINSKHTHDWTSLWSLCTLIRTILIRSG